jgi:predicted ferric reductase
VVILYFVGVVLLQSLSNFVYKFLPTLLEAFNFTLARKLRQHIVLPPLGRYHHCETRKVLFLKFNLPSRTQTLVIVGYMAINMICLFVDHEILLPNYSQPTSMQQYSRYIGSRSGLLVLAEMNLLFFFGGRNNFLIYLTGWPLETFNVFHRWIGRVIVVNSIVHAAAETINHVHRQKYLTSLRLPYFIWGIVSIIMVTFLVFHSFRCLRTRNYEVFLVMHISMAAVLLAALWHHMARPKHGLQFLYSSIAIWAFDRILRIVKISWSGIAYADVRLHNEDVLEFRVDYSRRWKAYSGSYAFIHVVKVSWFWQSHPLTLLNSPRALDRGKLVMYAKVKEGLTSGIRKLLTTTPNNCLRVPVLIDGPYGISYNIGHYGSVVFIAGGIGVTATYSYASQLKSDLCTRQRIVFIWVIPHAGHLHWFADELADLTSDPRIEVQVYMTGKQSSSLTSVVASTEGSEETPEFYKIDGSMFGRTQKPDIKKIVCDEIARANHSLAFLVCGPSSMNDDVRSTVSQRLTTARKVRVDYYEEAFSW